MIRIVSHIIGLCFLFQMIANVPVSAQNEVRVPRSSFKMKPDSFRIAYREIRKGNKWVDKGKGAIPKALGHYLKASLYNSSNPELNYKIGVSYLKSDQKAKSLAPLQYAYTRKPELTKNMLLLLGRAYQYNLKFDSAIINYEAYLKALKRKQKKKQSDAINKFVDECNAGISLLKQSNRVVMQNLGDSINSEYDDYNALLLPGDSMMYYTSRRPSKRKEKPAKKDYMFDEDIYTAQAKSGVWEKSVYLNDDGFNTKHSEAIVWVSDDGNTRYLYDGYIRGGDILVSTFAKGKWGHFKRLYRKFSKSGAESSISVTRDGNTIYFVSDGEAESFGGKDIYSMQKNEKGKWGKPKNVGSVINTKYNEDFVHISPDGKVMYFSSMGHNTMGGYDVFRSEQDGGGVWTKPVNLGIPINTPDDEICYRPDQNEKRAYFAAKRPDTHGGFDIYKVIYLGNEKKLVLSSEEQLVAYFDKPITDIFARVSGEEKIDTVYYMIGSITDAKRKTPIAGKLDLIDIESSQVIATTLSDSSGIYRIKLPQLKKYGVEVHAKDYMLFLDVVNIPSKIQGKEVTRNFALAKVEVGTKIVLKNIYFESGKAVLTPESNTELDKVVSFMKDNPDIKVEISGHTDNIGTQYSNQRLSEARAKAVVTYMIAHDIPQEKLVYKGYGFAQPIAPNTTANGRKLNRRVEFKILSVQ